MTTYFIYRNGSAIPYAEVASMLSVNREILFKLKDLGLANIVSTTSFRIRFPRSKNLQSKVTLHYILMFSR